MIQNENNNLYKSIAINKLNLSKFAHNSLRRAGIFSIDDVNHAIEENTLSAIPNIGVTTEKEIREKFERFLADLESEEPSPQGIAGAPGGEHRLKDLETLASIQDLEDALGKETIQKIIGADIFVLEQLSNLISAHLRIATGKDTIIDREIGKLINEVKSLIQNNGLQVGVSIDGVKLYNIIYTVPKNVDEKYGQYSYLKKFLKT